MFVIEYRSRLHDPRGYLGSTKDLTDSPDQARKFAQAGDALAWIAAHPMPEAFKSAGWYRTIAPTDEARSVGKGLSLVTR